MTYLAYNYNNTDHNLLYPYRGPNKQIDSVPEDNIDNIDDIDNIGHR